MDRDDHRRLILDQFTRQATPFAEALVHRDPEVLRLMVGLSGAGPADDVLDVGCGPGLVACAFAPVARTVTGTDVTPAMLAKGSALARDRGLANVTFLPAEMERLPFPGQRFSVVVTRYTFHHLLRPERGLDEMVRVCRPGGRVVIADAAVPAGKASAFDEMERVRDPSHVHALSTEELLALAAEAGLTQLATASYRLEVALEGALAASFPDPGGAERLRAMIEADIGLDRLGVAARRRDGKVRYAYPCAMVSGQRP